MADIEQARSAHLARRSLIVRKISGAECFGDFFVKMKKTLLFLGFNAVLY